MKRTKQHSKAVVYLAMLVLAIAGLFIVKNVLGHIGDGATNDGDDDVGITDNGIMRILSFGFAEPLRKDYFINRKSKWTTHL